MKKIAVFCGSKEGATPVYREAAERLGKELAKRGLTLVYGGSRVGTMGMLADSVLAHGGQAIGVLPTFLEEREIAHPNLTELILVESMHERKAKMTELADGFIALPGGPGTMEELFEVFTWAQLGLHEKPCGILNVGGYYDALEALFDGMQTQGFMAKEHGEIALFDTDAARLLERFATYQAPALKTYLTKDQT
ncbi:LOG family protein [Exiguobacterium flavidum]|uniref:LOG family protein n=1 Tax=Exiguobacterium flavidum TaxID=2184695 RepID=UPI000DF807A2|nr:TIGR00730 family Rossman fold protein [Exiguobacterium flavidum]